MNLKQSTFLTVLDFAQKLDSRIKFDLGNIKPESSTIDHIPSQKLFYLWKHYLVWGNHSSVDEIQFLVDYLTDPQTGKNWDQIINQVKQKNEVSHFILPNSLLYPRGLFL
jgi:hypothetical protein